MYPIAYAQDHEAENRNRLTTFFRGIVVIPWQIVAYLWGIAAGVVAVIAWFALLFTGRYPQGMYDFNAKYLRMATRTNALLPPRDRPVASLPRRRRRFLPGAYRRRPCQGRVQPDEGSASASSSESRSTSSR